MSNPQQILETFYAAAARSAEVKKMALGRPSDSIAGCVRKIVEAHRQHAIHVLEAASYALSQLPLPR